MVSKVNEVKFREWLINKKGKDVVGIGENECNCPLANFIKSNYNCKNGEVIVHSDKILVKGRKWKVESWAKTFVNQIDGEFYEAPITAYDALRILDVMDREY